LKLHPLSQAWSPTLVPQFHGRESGEFCDQFGRAYLKAIGVGQAGVPPDIEQLASYTRAVGFLFDSHEPGQPGGTGHAFDWTQIGESRYKAMVLAGGLNVHNVEQAIEQVRPYAVDVSSGVEIDKGLKDGQAMRDFMDAVGRADARLQTRQTEQLTG
jgi:phosphoribosylanthranilate isomerase